MAIKSYLAASKSKSIRLMARTWSLTMQPHRNPEQSWLLRRRVQIIPHLLSKHIETFPRFAQTVWGQQMEAMNVILIGSADDVTERFSKAGWYDAVHPHPLSYLWAGWALLANRRYRRGPFTPLFIGNHFQDLDFQKETQKLSFRQRHHLRLWHTGFELREGATVWLGSVSFDVGMRVLKLPPFLAHEIEDDLNKEREMLVKELKKTGAEELLRYHFLEPMGAVNAYGDHFKTDGILVVIDCRKDPDAT